MLDGSIFVFPEEPVKPLRVTRFKQQKRLSDQHEFNQTESRVVFRSTNFPFRRSVDKLLFPGAKKPNVKLQETSHSVSVLSGKHLPIKKVTKTPKIALIPTEQLYYRSNYKSLDVDMSQTANQQVDLVSYTS